MTKVAYNGCYGGFSLSYAAVMRYAELSGVPLYGFVSARKSDGGIDFRRYVPVTPEISKEEFCIHYRTKPSMDDDKDGEDTWWSDRDISRTDPNLIRVIEELGDDANGKCASLCIEEIPAGTHYRIDVYDGNERIETRDDINWSVA